MCVFTGIYILHRSGESAIHNKQCIKDMFDGQQMFEQMFTSLVIYGLAQQVCVYMCVYVYVGVYMYITIEYNILIYGCVLLRVRCIYICNTWTIYMLILCA